MRAFPNMEAKLDLGSLRPGWPGRTFLLRCVPCECEFPCRDAAVRVARLGLLEELCWGPRAKEAGMQTEGL